MTAYGILRFGVPATRTTRVLRSVEKQGRSGALTFVTARSEIVQDGALVVADEQDIVYRAAGSTLPPRAAPPPPAAPPAERATGRGDARTQLELDVDPVLLFRFSALTYNAHRIHYDRDYAEREGYPGLVVHGPLQALLMGEALRRSGTQLLRRTFSYRLVAPTYGAQRLTVAARADAETGGELVEARVRDGAGTVTATSTLRAQA